MTDKNPYIKSIFKNHNAPFVRRRDLGVLTGGLLHPRTMRNLDSKGQGIPGKFTIGKKIVAYPTEGVIAYLKSKISRSNKS